MKKNPASKFDTKPIVFEYQTEFTKLASINWKETLKDLKRLFKSLKKK